MPLVSFFLASQQLPSRLARTSTCPLLSLTSLSGSQRYSGAQSFQTTETRTPDWTVRLIAWVKSESRWQLGRLCVIVARLPSLVALAQIPSSSLGCRCSRFQHGTGVSSTALFFMSLQTLVTWGRCSWDSCAHNSWTWSGKFSAVDVGQ